MSKDEIFAVLYDMRLAPRHQLEDAAKRIANLQAAKPEQAKTAVVLPEPDFDALARIRDEAIGELLKKLFNAAVKYAGTSGVGYSPASADAYHAAEEIKTQITSTVTAYSPTQAEIESYATAKTAEAVRELAEGLRHVIDWINGAPHGDNCFLGDELSGNRCWCGKDSFVEATDALLNKYAPGNDNL